MIKKKIRYPVSNHQLKLKTTSDFDKMIPAVFFNSLGFFYYIFLLSFIPAKYFNATGPQIGMVFSSNIFGYLISSTIIGFLSDKYRKKKKLVTIGSFGRGIALILMYLAINFKSLKFFIGAVFFQGLIVMFFWNPLDILISEKSTKEYRTIAFARRANLIGVGSLVGTLIAFGILGVSTLINPENTWFFYSPLVIFAICNFYAAIRFYFDVNDEIIDLSDEKEIETNKIDKRVFIGFILLLVVSLLIAINNNFANPFLQAYLIEHIVQDPRIIMMIYFPSHIFAYIIAPKLGNIIKKINVYLAISLVCFFGAVSTWIVVSTTSGLVFSAVLLFDSLFVTVENLIKQTYMSKISIQHRGKIFSTMSFVQYFGAIVSPLAGGLVWEKFGHKFPFYITIIVELLLIAPYLLAIYFLITKKKPIQGIDTESAICVDKIQIIE